MEENIYLTRDGYNKYLKEIEDLKKIVADNGVKKSSAYIGAVGDGWHDNFEFEEAKREEIRLMTLLSDKIKRLNSIIVIDEELEENVVNVDDFVLCDIIYDVDDIEEMILHLIDSPIANKSNDYQDVTINSPIGKAIYNKPIGAKVSFNVNGNKSDLLIKEKIEYKGLKL